jgi:hypothetical protein
MRTKKLVMAGLLICLVAGAYGQQEERSALLPEIEAHLIKKWSPKHGPNKIDGSWLPSKAQLDALEASIPHISDLRSGGAPKGGQIAHPEQYYRQYLALIRAGQKLIRVNAFCDVKDLPHWRDQPEIVMDGGDCYWQAWYDPATGKFLDFYINGRA